MSGVRPQIMGSPVATFAAEAESPPKPCREPRRHRRWALCKRKSRHDAQQTGGAVWSRRKRPNSLGGSAPRGSGAVGSPREEPRRPFGPTAGLTKNIVYSALTLSRKGSLSLTTHHAMRGRVDDGCVLRERALGVAASGDPHRCPCTDTGCGAVLARETSPVAYVSSSLLACWLWTAAAIGVALVGGAEGRAAVTTGQVRLLFLSPRFPHPRPGAARTGARVPLRVPCRMRLAGRRRRGGGSQAFCRGGVAAGRCTEVAVQKKKCRPMPEPVYRDIDMSAMMWSPPSSHRSSPRTQGLRRRRRSPKRMHTPRKLVFKKKSPKRSRRQ